MTDQSIADAPGTNEGKAGGVAKPKHYKIQIDKVHYEVPDPIQTGRQLLVLAGKTPPDQYGLYLKGAHGQPRRIPLDESVDLRDPGVEKFVTLPLDQTEG